MKRQNINVTSKSWVHWSTRADIRWSRNAVKKLLGNTWLGNEFQVQQFEELEQPLQYEGNFNRKLTTDDALQPKEPDRKQDQGTKAMFWKTVVS